MRLMLPAFVIAAMLLLAAGCTQANAPEVKTPVPVSPQTGSVMAAYGYPFPDPNDDTYSLVMPAKDRIPWTKITRLSIGFATVKDRILTDLPTGARRPDSRSPG
ncbi:hypothetical protein [Methanoregula formicica]|uniref:Uncharacterized protein n=1 Tax=Methanoregula formicica (strain DSM 22288 / NBRC 105244 / SMSP) TaxID=593750 RepID=L0HCT7_METFS|nr:hypothetical protein [Methanoregula formicica]AGB01606.1 hypothetical protein Metfor_0537 [Methanoregula formicica SMSP]